MFKKYICDVISTDSMEVFTRDDSSETKISFNIILGTDRDKKLRVEGEPVHTILLNQKDSIDLANKILDVFANELLKGE